MIIWTSFVKIWIFCSCIFKANTFLSRILIWWLIIEKKPNQLWLEIWIQVLVIHRGFLEHWNSQKRVSNIWLHFSCLLDEGIPKIWKKLNSRDGFLSYLQNSTANSAHVAADFCPALVCPQKATKRIQFLPYFWNPLIK